MVTQNHRSSLVWTPLHGITRHFAPKAGCENSEHAEGVLTGWLVQLQFRQQGQSSNVMSFRYEQGPVVTILVSKSAGRYRVQSDSFEAMWLIVQVWSIAAILSTQSLLACSVHGTPWQMHGVPYCII